MKTLALMALPAFSACGHLTVSLDVLDPQVVEREIDRLLNRELLPVVLADTEQSIAIKCATIRAEHFAFYDKLKAQYLEDALQLTGQEKVALEYIANSLTDDFGSIFDPYYSMIAGELTNLTNSITNLQAEIDGAEVPERQRELLDSQRARLRQLSETSHNFANYVASDTNDLVAREITAHRLSATVLRRFTQTAENINENARTTLFGQSKSLRESPLAYAVAAAPSEAWAEDYNHAYGGGVCGNLDVAIKLESESGDFTVKGLAFDPGDVALTASKVTLQALLISAQIAGVPVDAPAGLADDSPGAALTRSSGRVADLERAAFAKDARARSARRALVAVAQAIVRERDALADDAARMATIQAIKVTFEAHKGQIHAGGQ